MITSVFKPLLKSSLLVLALSLPVAAHAEIKIGVAAPLSGVYAPLGNQLVNGATFAAQEINRNGGIDGEQITIEAIDDKCEGKIAESIANQLVGRGVIAVIGHLCDRPSIEAAPVYAENGIIQISPGSQNPSYTDNRPVETGGTYRLAARNTQQADTITEFVLSQDAMKIAILNDGSAYGKGLADILETELQEAAITPTLVEAFEPGEERYSRLASRIVDSGATTVFIGGYHADAAIIIRDVDQLTRSIQFIAGDGIVHPEFRNILLDNNRKRVAANNIFMSFPPDPRLFPWAQETVRKLEEAGEKTIGLTLRGYSAVKILEQALNEAETKSYGGLSTMLNTLTFTTPLGDISFDDRGDADLIDYLMHRWKGATVVPYVPENN